jgi:hypothetical protein
MHFERGQICFPYHSIQARRIEEALDPVQLILIWASCPGTGKINSALHKSTLKLMIVLPDIIEYHGKEMLLRRSCSMYCKGIVETCKGTAEVFHGGWHSSSRKPFMRWIKALSP